MLWGTDSSKILEIAAVHRNDIDEVFEVIQIHATRALVTEVNTAFAGSRPRTWIGRPAEADRGPVL